MPEKLKFATIRQPMPISLLVAPFLSCILLPGVMLLTAIDNHHNVGLSIAITAIGVVTFAVFAWIRNKMWHDGTFHQNAATRQENSRQ